MYQVLIVDDEPVIKLALRNAVDWQQYGYQLCPPCANGQEALEYIRENPVDILITDIVMPVLDGLGLIAALAESGFAGAILVLSNYSDFSLVRTALKQGAIDYIIKANLSSETLLQQLAQAAQIVNERRQQTTQRQESARQADILYTQLLTNYLLDRQALSPAQLGILENAPQGHLPRQLVYLVLQPSGGGEIKSTVYAHVMGLVADALEAGRGEAVSLDGTHVLLILYGTDDGQPYNTTHLLDQLRRNLRLYFNLGLCAVLSDTCMSLQEVRRQFAACASAAGALFYRQQDVLQAGAVAFLPAPPLPSGTAEELVLFGPIDAGGQLPKQLGSFLEAAPEGMYQPSGVLAALTAVLLQEAEISGQLPPELDTLPKSSTLAEALQNFTALHNSLAAPTGANGRESAVIHHYLYTHMAEEITLKQLAEQLHLNPSYVSRLFKKQTGENIFTYLHRMRMERAAQLLRGQEYYIKEIARMVGYADSQYFTRAFTKYYKQSPTQYRGNGAG